MSVLRESFDAGQRRLRRRAEVPAGAGPGVPARPRRARDVDPDAPGDGLRRDPRPCRRRLCPLQRRRALDGPALREDALRQRAAGAGLPSRLAGDAARSHCGRPAWTRWSGPCARCAAPREPSTAPWTPTARAWRAATTCGLSRRSGRPLGEDGESAIAWLGASEQGNFSDPHHPAPGLNVLQDRGPRPEPGGPRADPRGPGARAAGARAPRARRQAHPELECADGQRARRGGGGAGRAPLSRCGRRVRGLPALPDAR